MIYSVTLTTENEFTQSWSDSSCPNLGWTFIEETFEDCLQEDGTYVATYDTLVVPEGETMCFTYLTDSGETTYHLGPGEYGIKPS
jgi:hypothetical protein